LVILPDKLLENLSLKEVMERLANREFLFLATPSLMRASENQMSIQLRI